MELVRQDLTVNPKEQNFIGNCRGDISSSHSSQGIVYFKGQGSLLVGGTSRSLSYYSVLFLYLLSCVCNSYLVMKSARLSTRHPAQDLPTPGSRTAGKRQLAVGLPHSCDCHPWGSMKLNVELLDNGW